MDPNSQDNQPVTPQAPAQDPMVAPAPTVSPEQPAPAQPVAEPAMPVQPAVAPAPLFQPDNMAATTQESPTVAPMPSMPAKHGSKKTIVVLVVLIVLLAATAAVLLVV